MIERSCYYRKKLLCVRTQIQGDMGYYKGKHQPVSVPGSVGELYSVGIAGEMAVQCTGMVDSWCSIQCFV